MSKLINLERITLKGNPTINETVIQDYIYKNPSVLGLGDLTPITREKVQPAGGRLDILLGNDDGDRYEVEVQLGATDPSHIIRTIEYWDVERKRYPDKNHCAVIVAEEITSRFLNVISLFNGHLPLIAIQVNAYKSGSDTALIFTKILDRVELGSEEEDGNEVTDRNYWNSRSTPKMLEQVDAIYNDISQLATGYELKYNKFYIGLSKNGVAKNFVVFKPKKAFLYLSLKGNENVELIDKVEGVGLDISYQPRWKEYAIKLSGYAEYKKHKELLNELIKESMNYLSVFV